MQRLFIEGDMETALRFVRNVSFIVRAVKQCHLIAKEIPSSHGSLLGQRGLAGSTE